MREVRNSKGKLVCRVNSRDLLVEIICRGVKTTIRFLPDGTFEVINSDKG
jgi:hypothetical protein